MDDYQKVIKQIRKLANLHVKDTTELGILLEKPKGNKREAGSLISRMIIRTETTWQDLRALGRSVDKNEKE